MVIGGGEGAVGPLVHGCGRRNIEHRPAADRGRMIERQAMCHPATAVMADQVELGKTQLPHQRHLVRRHGALGVARMVRAAIRLA